MSPLSSELAALRELQRRDHALAESLRRKAALPGRRREVQQALDAARAAHEKAKQGLDAERLARRKLEKEAEAVEAEVTRLERQLFDVKTNDEYKAMQHQIATRKEKDSELETAILESMEREEWGVAAVKAEEQAAAAAAKAKTAADAALEAEEAALAAEIVERTAARDAARAGLPAAVLSRYDRLLGARDGTAVVEVSQNACAGCHRALTPHDLQVVRAGETILVCEGCGRIVIDTEAAV
jgi:predicted  nucleic acid-binding Zn-ribbon protein